MDTLPNVIYSYGGGEILNTVFNIIAAFFREKDVVMPLISTVVGFALCAKYIQFAQTFNLKTIITYSAFQILLISLFVTNTTTVTIKDRVNRTFYIVDNIPLGLAVLGSTISNITYGVTEFIDKLGSAPDDIGYTKTGMVFASRALIEAKNTKAINPTFKSNLSNFITQCIANEEDIGVRINEENLKNSSDIWALIKEEPPVNLGIEYIHANGTREYVKCPRAITLIEADFVPATKSIAQRMTLKLFPKMTSLDEGSSPNNFLNEISKQEAEKLYPLSFSYLTNVSKTSHELIRQQLLINTYNSAIPAKASSLGNSVNLSAAMGLVNQVISQQTAGELSKTTMPILHSFCQGFIYACFILVFFMFLTANGYQYLRQFAFLILWVEIWPILCSIVNIFISATIKNKTMNLLGGAEGLTIANRAEIISSNDIYAGIAGFVNALVPYIAYKFANGTIATIGDLSHQFMHNMQSASSQAGSMVASSNLGFGNVSTGVRSYNMLSGNKYDTNYAFASGAQSLQMEDGSLRTEQSGGGQIYVGGAGRTSSVAHSSFRLDDTVDQILSNSRDTGLRSDYSYGQAYSKAVEDAQMTGTEVLAGMANNMANGKSYNFGTNTEVGEMVNKTHEFAESFNQMYGKNNELGAKIGAGLSMGFTLQDVVSRVVPDKVAQSEVIQTALGAASKIGMNLNADGHYSKSSQDSFQNSINSSSNSSASDSLHSLKRYVEDDSRNITDSSERALRDSFSDSYREMESLQTHENKSFGTHMQVVTSEQDVRRYAASRGADYTDMTREHIESYINPETGRNYTSDQANSIMQSHKLENMAIANKAFEEVVTNDLVKSGHIKQETFKGQIKEFYDNNSLSQVNSNLGSKHADRESSMSKIKSGVTDVTQNNSLEGKVKDGLQTVQSQISSEKGGVSKKASINSNKINENLSGVGDKTKNANKKEFENVE